MKTVTLRPGDLAPLKAGAGRGGSAITPDLQFAYDGNADLRGKNIRGFQSRAVRPGAFLRDYKRRFGGSKATKRTHPLNLIKNPVENWEFASGHFDAVNEYFEKERRAFRWEVDVQIALSQGYDPRTDQLQTRRRTYGIVAFPPESLQVDTSTLRDVHAHRLHMRERDSYVSAPLRIDTGFLEEEELYESGELPGAARKYMLSIDGLLRKIRDDVPKMHSPDYGLLGDNARVRFILERATAIAFPLKGLQNESLYSLASQWLHDVVEWTSGENRKLWWDSKTGQFIHVEDHASMVRRVPTIQTILQT